MTLPHPTARRRSPATEALTVTSEQLTVTLERFREANHRAMVSAQASGRATPGYAAALTKAAMHLREAWTVACRAARVVIDDGIYAEWLAIVLGTAWAPTLTLHRSARPRAAARPKRPRVERETFTSIMASGKVRIIRTPKQIWGQDIPTGPKVEPGQEPWHHGKTLRSCSPATAQDWLSIVCLPELTPAQKAKRFKTNFGGKECPPFRFHATTPGEKSRAGQAAINAGLARWTAAGHEGLLPSERVR